MQLSSPAVYIHNVVPRAGLGMQLSSPAVQHMCTSTTSCQELGWACSSARAHPPRRPRYCAPCMQCGARPLSSNAELQIARQLPWHPQSHTWH
jgi:hypothetical protein